MDIIKSRDLITTQICDRFKEEIKNGKYLEGQALPSYGSLAEAYGISKSTVHEAFKILSSEGYLFLKHGKGAYPNPVMIAKRKGKPLTDIAVVAFGIFSANDNYMIPLLEAMHSLAETKKIRLHFHFIRGMSIQNKENSVLKEAIIYGRFDGIIIASPIDTSDLKWLEKFRMPFVAATSRYALPVKQVLIDHAKAANSAFDIFTKHRVDEIALFTGPLDWERDGIKPFASELYEAFAKRAKESATRLCMTNCDYSYHDAMRKALTFFRDNYNFGGGIFFQSDIIAKGVLAAAQKMNIDLRSCTIINYCDLEDYIAPINLYKPLQQVGEAALNLLIETKLAESKNETILLSPTLPE